MVTFVPFHVLMYDASSGSSALRTQPMWSGVACSLGITHLHAHIRHFFAHPQFLNQPPRRYVGDAPVTFLFLFGPGHAAGSATPVQRLVMRTRVHRGVSSADTSAHRPFSSRT